MSSPYALPEGYRPVDAIGVEPRARFIARTYNHLMGAIVGFTLFEIALFQSGVAEPIAQTMLGYNDTVAPLKELAVVYGFPVARSSKNSALMPFPLDHGVWSEQASRVMTALMDAYKAEGFTGGFDMWVTGTLSPVALERLTDLGYRVTENVDDKIGFLD